MPEISTKPYLIRAIYDWCTDNGYTPYLAVIVDAGTAVPQEYVRNGEIVLNISALATSKLHLGNELIEFQARFGGSARSISVPIANVSAIYARENGQGMAFEVTPVASEEQNATPVPALPAPAEDEAPATLQSVPSGDDDTPPEPGGGPKGKPKLTVVK